MADKDNKGHVGNSDEAHNNTKERNKWKPVPKTTFKGETTSIEDYVFVHSQLHTKKWMTSRQKFIDYAGKTYGGNEETSLVKRDITIITMDEPIEPVESDLTGLTKLKREFTINNYSRDYKVYMDLHLKTKNNLTKLYKVLWGQCDPIMKNKIKGDPRYTLADAMKSSIELLSIIETICEQGDITKNKRVQRLAAMKKVLTFRQHDEMDLGEYLEKFEILVSVAEKTGVKFYADDDIKDVIEELGLVKGIGTDSFDEEEKVKRLARERALAILFFDNSNDNKYAIYKQECRNAMAKGRDEYQLPSSRHTPHWRTLDSTQSSTRCEDRPIRDVTRSFQDTHSYWKRRNAHQQRKRPSTKGKGGVRKETIFVTTVTERMNAWLTTVHIKRRGMETQLVMNGDECGAKESNTKEQRNSKRNKHCL